MCVQGTGKSGCLERKRRVMDQMKTFAQSQINYVACTAEVRVREAIRVKEGAWRCSLQDVFCKYLTFLVSHCQWFRVFLFNFSVFTIQYLQWRSRVTTFFSTSCCWPMFFVLFQMIKRIIKYFSIYLWFEFLLFSDKIKMTSGWQK